MKGKERGEWDTPRFNPVILVLLGVVGVSTSPILFRYATAPASVIAAYRMGISALLLLPAVLRGHRQEIRQALTGRLLLAGLLCGAMLGLHFVFYNLGLRDTSIASCAVLVNTEVFFVAFFSYLLWKEKISRSMLLGMGITFLGSVVVSLGDGSVARDMLRGDLYAVLGALFGCGYTMMGSWMRRGLSTVLYTFLIYTSSFVLLSLVNLGGGYGMSGYGLVNLLVALGQAVLCTLLGHSVYSWGLRYCRASLVSTVKLSEPVFSTLFALALFQEVPTWSQVLGGAVILAGLLYYLHARPPAAPAGRTGGGARET